MRRTALHRSHGALGARTVDFGGWEMPLHYGSQIEEHLEVRHGAGMFDVSHMLAIDIAGPGARSLLLRLLANNVDRLDAPGMALYSCMLNESGGILDDLIVYFLGDHQYRLVVNAATADADVAWLRAWLDTCSPPPKMWTRHDLSIIAVQGPRARERVWQAMPEWRKATEQLLPFHAASIGETLVSRTGYTGEDGFELMLPSAQAPTVWEALLAAGVRPAGLGARDTLRLEAGMCLYGQDLNTSVTPLECRLDWTVDFSSPRDFVGKQALGARPVMRNLFGLVLLDRGVLRAHQPVLASGGPGEITSGTFSPTLQISIGFARLPATVLQDEIVKVEIRDRWLSARTVKYPFVRHGRSLLADNVTVR